MCIAKKTEIVLTSPFFCFIFFFVFILDDKHFLEQPPDEKSAGREFNGELSKSARHDIYM